MMKGFVFLAALFVLVTAGGCSGSLPEQDNTLSYTGENPVLTDENGITGDEPGEIKGTAEGMDIIMYYRDSTGLVIPVTRRIARLEAVATAAVTGLIDSAATREELRYYGLYPVLPAGTQVQGINIKDGTAVVDFSPQILQYDSQIEEAGIFSSVVYTLTQFATVNDVVIWINGFADRELKYGNSIKGCLNRKNTMINSERLNAAGNGLKMDVYYYRDLEVSGPCLVPQSIETGVEGREEMAEEAVRRMVIKGSSGEMYSAIPAGVRLLECRMEGNGAALGFNEHITDCRGAYEEELMIRQLLFTMGQIPGISRLKLSGQGGDWVSLPRRINYFIDR